MGYIHKVERPEGRVTRVEAEVNGVYLSFVPGKDGKPREVSRTRGAMVYDHNSLLIPRDRYFDMMRVVRAVMAESPRKPTKPRKPMQLGFHFEEANT